MAARPQQDGHGASVPFTQVPLDVAYTGRSSPDLRIGDPNRTIDGDQASYRVRWHGTGMPRTTQGLPTHIKALLTSHVQKGTTWQALKADGLAGPVRIGSTDALTSNSGFTLAQLELTALATSDLATSPTLEQARTALPALRRIYETSGLQAASTDDGFRQWLTQGGEYSAPLYAGYENQLIQYWNGAGRPAGLMKDVTVLYPNPTVFADHPVLALSPEAERLVTAMSEMSIDFGAITGAPNPTAGAAETTVATQVDKALATGGEPGAMSCLAMLSTAQQEQARTVAVQQLPTMLADTDKLATFGDPALQAVNAQVNRIFTEVGPVRIPELTTTMHEINDRMRAFRHHYDPADPRVRETFERFTDAVRGVFLRGRDMVEMLFEEAHSVEQQLDRIAGQLALKQRELKRNVVLCDELYRANEASISQLVGVIAVMEAVLEEAQEQADGIVVGPSAPNAHELTEQRARLTDFTMALQTRINEFQQRLFVARSTSPPRSATSARCTTDWASVWPCW